MMAKKMDWTFTLLTALLLLFFIAGIILDYLSSDLGFDPADLVSYKENTQHPDSTETVVTREALIDEDVQENLFSTIENRINGLHESAKLMYDFSKIILGALIANITQIATMRYKKESA